MTFRLIVQSTLERHRPKDKSLIAKMTFSLKVAGAAVNPVTTPADAVARFDVTNDALGTSVELTVQIPPQGAMTKPIMTATQKFTIGRTASKGKGPPSPMLQPVSGAKGLLHPRFLPPRAVAAATGMQIQIVIDTTWLDLTEYASVLSRDASDIKSFPSQASSRLIVVENSGGGLGLIPTTWLILVPPSVSASAASLNLFLFFRPEITDAKDIYKNTDDLPFANRFLRYAFAERTPGRYVLGGTFGAFRLAGFEPQLAASGKPVVLLFPMPHVTSWGAVETSRLTQAPSAATPDILDHLLRSLWADGSLAGGAGAIPTVQRLALGGFSLGGDVCLKSWGQNKDKVDELYLFDPGQGIPGTVASWFLAKPTDRRLRMMGCAYSENMSNQLAASIGQSLTQKGVTPPANHWLAKPGDPTFWYGPVYQQALSDPANPADLESLDSATGTASSSATKASNIFMVSSSTGPTNTGTANQAQLTISAKWSGQTGTPPSHLLTKISNAEAASYLHHWVIAETNGGAPVTSNGQFSKVQAGIQLNDFNGEQPRSSCVRHEWAVIGGEQQGGVFKGFLRMCLEGSGFV